VTSPIEDVVEDKMNHDILLAVKKLHDMLNVQKLKVYVHCTSSVTRAPTVVTTYMALYVRHPMWKQPNLIAQNIKEFHKVSWPNMKAVHTIIKGN